MILEFLALIGPSLTVVAVACFFVFVKPHLSHNNPKQPKDAQSSSLNAVASSFMGGGSNHPSEGSGLRDIDCGDYHYETEHIHETMTEQRRKKNVAEQEITAQVKQIYNFIEKHKT